MTYTVPTATAKDLAAALALEILIGEEWLDKAITIADINRPALEMAGYFDHYPGDRVQVLGQTETDFFNTLEPEIQRDRARRLLLAETPCLIFSRDLEPPEAIFHQANRAQVPVLGSSLATTRLITRLGHWLDNALAPRQTLHGVLMDLFGVGVLLMGESGVGKSETALELIKMGHRLIADDAVEIRRPAETVLVGRCPRVLTNLLEIRGLGIIDVVKVFGFGAVRPEKRVELILHFQRWQEGDPYDRLGFDTQYHELLGVKVPIISVPVAAGRNLAMLVETAAANFRARTYGSNVQEELMRRIDEEMVRNR
ncbi:MAG: HPr(Ser) kinase/phosphatase [Bacillota bacterium]|jgi:HPr kinase/phosphorylase